MKALEQAAEELRAYIKENPEEKDGHLAYEAVDILMGEQESRWDKVDQTDTPDGDTLHYVELEGERTIGILDGKVYVGTLKEIQAPWVKAHCEKHNAKPCSACGELNHKDCEECGHCKSFTDGSGEYDHPELSKDIADCIEDGGSDRYIWMMKERLPTHETVKNHSYVFLQLDIAEAEQKYRGYYEKPDTVYGSICIVNVGSAGKNGMREVCSQYNLDEEDWKAMPHAEKAMRLHDVGIHATVHQAEGKSCQRVLAALMEELPKVMMHGGFYLDRPANGIGSTGWDFLKGDILAGLATCNTPPGALMRKLYGM